MIHLVWQRGHWKFKEPGIIVANLMDLVIEIPVGRGRPGAFYISRIGEDEWRIAPVKFPKNRPESYDGNGRFSGFIIISGAPDETNTRIDQI